MRGSRSQCRIFKRCLTKCLVIFAAVSLLPFALIYLISTDQIYRIKNYEFGNSTSDSSSVHHHHPAKPLSPSEVDAVESRMLMRSLRLIERCSLFGLDLPGNDSLHKPNSWEFLINKKHHLVWCNVFKAASTSWMYNFNILAGYSPQFLRKSQVVPLTLARKKYPRPSVTELLSSLNNSISFLIVRHPFERLLSAYNDKLKFALPHTFHQKLGNLIVRKFRKAVSYERADSAAFPLMNSVHSHQQSKQRKLGSRWPTFPEFVDFLLFEANSGSSLDMHWTPISTFCTPCQVKFDMILKFETLEDDQRYLIEKAGLSKLGVRPEHKNPGKGKHTNESLVNSFSELTTSQVRGLYEIFKYDFEIFDYSPDAFMKIARDDDLDEMSETRKQQIKKEKSKILPLS